MYDNTFGKALYQFRQQITVLLSSQPGYCQETLQLTYRGYITVIRLPYPVLKANRDCHILK